MPSFSRKIYKNTYISFQFYFLQLRKSFSQRTSESEDSKTNENDDEPSASCLPPQQIGEVADNQLSKNFYHDSGIDICDSATPAATAVNVTPNPNKKVYSDADIVLGSDWVPPKTLTTTKSIETPSSNTTSNLLTQNVETGARKKTSSVSFSVEDDQASNVSQTENNEKSDKKGKVGFVCIFLGLSREKFSL